MKRIPFSSKQAAVAMIVFILLLSSNSATGRKIGPIGQITGSFVYDTLAYDFVVEGIYYKKISDNTCEATYRMFSTEKTYNNGNLTKTVVTYSNNYTGDIIIPDKVTSNGSTFQVVGITDFAFQKSSTTSITIPSSIKSIGINAFDDCTNLNSVSIPSSVTSISDYAFRGCTSLTDVTLNSNSLVSSTSSSLKYIFGTQVKTYTIGESVTTIGEKAFSGCSGLTNINIPSSVTSIGGGAFEGCSGLTNINIPSSVTSIGERAFSGCSGLTSINIPSSVTSIGDYTFSACSGLTNINIPNSVTSIGDYAFNRCTGLMSITIPGSVTSIGSSAFKDCTGLTKVIVPDIAKWCDINFSSNVSSYISNPLYYAKHLYIDENTEVKDLVIPNGTTSISSNAFYGCTGLTSITVPESVTTIGYHAFEGCSNLSKIYVKKGSKALIQVWKVLPTNATAYDTDMITMLPKPYMTFKSATQTTVTYELHNSYEEYTFSAYYYSNVVFKNGTATVTELVPEEEVEYYLSVDNYDINSGKVTAKAASLNLDFVVLRTASSLNLKGIYTKGDALIKYTSITLDGNTVDGNIVTSSKGLKPYSSHEATYKVVIAYRNDDSLEKTYTKTSTFYTSALSLETSQPKVVSSGNVIIAATTNVDDEETNVGFEWRREDWSDTFASQTGAAVLYDGTMEGYIRNMNAEKLWKYRAYYLDNDGTYYYGDWVGIDPSNTSYFEPTVRTYANISVKGNTALVKGYALNGTDKIKVQGFKYWKTANKGNSLDIDREGDMLATAIPADAITKTVDIVGSGQQLMNATLEGLDYDATYHCVAFATTTENETFYGEEQMFTTESITGIEGVKESAAGSSKAVTVVAYYDLNGKRLSQPQKGLNIIRMSDGTTRKIVTK